MTENIIGSRMPADNTYGRTGDPSASSDLPGKKTETGFAKTADPVRDKLIREGFSDRSGTGDPTTDLQRKISDKALPPAHGMKKV